MACVSLKQFNYAWKKLNLELEMQRKGYGPACLKKVGGLEKITIVVIQFNESVFVVIL